MSELHPAGAPDLAVVRQVLELRAGETVALSVLFSRGADARAFRLPEQVDAAAEWVSRQARADVTLSIGVATLSAAGAERLEQARAANRRARPRATDHAGYAWLAADLDPHDGEDLAQLRARVETFPLAPTLLACSGRGLHAWYRLAETVDVATGRAAADDLARALAGDAGAATVDRALRLPGTWNPKPDAACLAYLLDQADVAHPVDEMVAAARALAPPPAPPPRRPAPPRPAPTGGDIAEAIRAEHDLADTLTELAGAARNGAWSCPSGHDTGPSLHLLRDDPQRWVCEGAGHPDDLGRRTATGRFSGDVIDLLAFAAKTTPRQYLAGERSRRQPARPSSAAGRTRTGGLAGEPSPVDAERRVASSSSTAAEGAGREPGRPSVADKIMTLALERFDLGWNPEDGAYAVPREGARVVRMLKGNSQSLRAELAKLFYARHGSVPSAGALADAMNTLEGRARDTDPHPLGLRIAQLEDPLRGTRLVLDLGDNTGRAVVIDAAGWTITDDDQPVLFRRTPLTAALPVPTRDGRLDELRELLNVTDDSWLLVRGALVAAYLSDVPHPIVLLTGEHGTGKTTAARLLVKLLDPSPAPLRSSPHKEDDWGITANGSYVVGIDNVSTIPAWLSDAWCRAVTGDGYVRRQLYTDSDLNVIALRRQIVLTGIDPSGLRGDLADRLLRIELQVIPASQRRTDRVLNATWDAAHPRILGALLDLLVQTLRVLPAAREQMTERPRMADFAEILGAVDIVTKSDSLSVFRGQGDRLSRDVVEGDPVGAALLQLLDNRREMGQPVYTGEAAQLLTALAEAAPPGPRPPAWPNTPAALGHALRRLAPALRACDIAFSSSRVNGRRVIQLKEAGSRR